MNEKSYKKTYNLITGYKYGELIINLLNNFLTSIVYAIYPIVLIVLLVNKDLRIYKTILIPGISFIAISIFRKLVDFPRPYEVYNIRQIIKKNSKGRSFPSRHVFSAFVIGGTLYNLWPILGTILLIIASIIAILRVVGGVHFPKDVLFGAGIGIFFSYIGWVLL